MYRVKRALAIILSYHIVYFLTCTWYAITWAFVISYHHYYWCHTLTQRTMRHWLQYQPYARLAINHAQQWNYSVILLCLHLKCVCVCVHICIECCLFNTHTMLGDNVAATVSIPTPLLTHATLTLLFVTNTNKRLSCYKIPASLFVSCAYSVVCPRGSALTPWYNYIFFVRPYMAGGPEGSGPMAFVHPWPWSATPLVCTGLNFR